VDVHIKPFDVAIEVIDSAGHQPWLLGSGHLICYNVSRNPRNASPCCRNKWRPVPF
jgi:hypothetical protein